MLREAWRKWRVNFLGLGVEEDIFLKFLGGGGGFLVD